MFATLISPADNKGVGVAFTNRLGGVSIGAQASLNLGRSDLDEIVHLRTNMARVRVAVGTEAVVALHQVHGVAVHHPNEDDRDWSGDAWLGDRLPGAPQLPVADAVVATMPGLALMIRVADCVPVLLADSAAGVIGAAHVGRAGLLGGVLDETVSQMRRAGARDLQAWIGPHICGSCYEVPEEMAAEAARLVPAAESTTSWGTPSIDLGAGVESQLGQINVEAHRCYSCTLTSDDLFSHRGDGPHAGRQVGLIWLV